MGRRLSPPDLTAIIYLRKQLPTCNSQDGYEPDEITVTPAMLKAGLDDLREHSFGDDVSLVLQSVYRAMAYAALAERAASPHQ